MDDYRQQQIDVLKEAVPYSEKLIGAIEKVSEELSGVPFPETHDAVNVIIEGLNWLFEVYNGTKDIIDACLLYTSPSPRDGLLTRMPSSA